MIEKYNPVEEEPNILKFWQENKIYAKAKKKSENGKPFYFLDGPPYTSGKIHLGTAWNKSLKDQALRFKRMQGFNVWDRAGYDMHGMPIELAVQKKLEMKSKDEIPAYGVANFMTECKSFAISNLKAMNKEFERIGVWMDFEDPYMSVKNEYIEGEWWLIKKAHENNRLYEGKKTVHWCAKCATALAKHELEYEKVTDTSIFVKFKIKDSKDEYLIIWTTTPWTIPFNLGVMVNPELTYVKAKVDDEVWIVAKDLADNLVVEKCEKGYTIIEEIKGSELEGIKYIHPFEKHIEEYKELVKDSPKIHSVVLSEEYVTTESGSGLVHMAPGCGPEDYEVGHRNNIRPFNNLSQAGIFPETMGKFKGLRAKKDDALFIEALEKEGAIVNKTKYSHDYAHCWRCKSPIIYRTTKQWFFKIEDLKDKMRELNKDIDWMPDYAGTRNYDMWLENLRDNGITRQRYWGCPLPVWKCNQCEKYDVIGSAEELKEKAESVPEDLHKPWIDEIEYDCECGGKKKRSPDILDVWIDSGSASWNCLYYPRRKDLFESMFPADFILEGIDQIRGWFNLLFVASMVSMEKPSFKSVYMHGFINDSQGRKMSKSIGNYIVPAEIIDKYGADTLRYYMVSAANPGNDMNYNFEDMQVKHKNLNVLWNIHKYVIDLSRQLGINPERIEVDKNNFSVAEKYIFSRLHSTIRHLTFTMEKFKLNEAPLIVEEFFLDISRTYIQLIREKASIGSTEDKKIVLYTLYNTLKDTIKMFAINAPYITEMIFLNFKEEFKLDEESIHHSSWPEFDTKSIDKELEDEMREGDAIIQAILYGREKLGKGVRWPIKEAIIVTEYNDVMSAVNNLAEIIKTQTNVKELVIKEKLEGAKTSIKVDYKKLGPDFGDKVPKIIAKLSSESSQSILKAIEKDGKYSFNVDGEEVSIVKEHIIVKREVPYNHVEVESKRAIVYLNNLENDELLAEGYSREIMRRVQVLRKNAGLNKNDEIGLHIKGSENSVDMLKMHEESIKDKVGATHIEISPMNPAKKHEFYSKEKIKGKEFEIAFDKIGIT